MPISMPHITIASYKNNIASDLFNNEKIVKGIDSQQPRMCKGNKGGVDPDEPSTLFYNNIWPYLKVKRVQTIADAHILFDVDILNINTYNPTYAKYCVKFRILVHEDRMKINIKDYHGTRIDYLYEEIKNQFDECEKYGFSKFALQSRRADVFDEDYMYVDMTFYTNELRNPVSPEGKRNR